MRRLWPRPPSRDMAAARAILACGACRDPGRARGPRLCDRALPQPPEVSAVSLPFRSMREGSPIGAIAVGRPEPGPFPDKQIALLQTFADQAVIAIENVRLFTELEARNADLTEALEQQTATSDILRVISQSPIDVQPVFDTIAAAALELCRARSANVFTFDGELIHLASLVNPNPAYIEAVRQYFPRPPSRDTAIQRAVLTRSVVAIPDVLEDEDYSEGASLDQGASAASWPFRCYAREARSAGSPSAGAEPGPFPDKQIALLQTFADQAVIAIENVRLFKELETRNRDLTEALEQQTATSEILRVISQSPTDVQPVFDTIAAAALKLCSASSANVYTFDGELIHLVPLVNAESGIHRGDAQAFSHGHPAATRRSPERS